MLEYPEMREGQIVRFSLVYNIICCLLLLLLLAEIESVFLERGGGGEATAKW